MVSGWSGPASWPCGRQRVGRAEATEGAGLRALSGFLPPPRERSQGAGDLPETEGELPVLEGYLETLGLPLESALP